MIAALVAATAIGCGDDGDDQAAGMGDRITRLEARLDSIEYAVRHREGTGGDVDRPADDQVKRLEAKLDELQAKLDRLDRPSPPVPPAPSRPGTPDPDQVYAVPIDGAPWVGAAKPTVIMVEGFEFACPYCERSRGVLRQLLIEYPDDLRIVYKHFIVHPALATEPAWAACAAGRQGKFGALAELLWNKGFLAGRDFSRDHVEELAREAKLDMSRFRRDRDGDCAEVVRNDQEDLRRVGQGGTPGFFINGRYLSGARPIEQFRTLIDAERKLAVERIAAGARADRYYQDWVLERGKKSL